MIFTVDNLLFLSFIVICVIAAIIIFLVIKRRHKTHQYDFSDDNIARKNPLYFVNNTEEQHIDEQEL